MSGNVYSRDQARKVQTPDSGTVTLVREVRIEGTKSAVGVIAGGILGAALGSTIGGGSGQVVATATGAVIGGLAGSAAEEGITRQNGLEITVELDSGESVVIVQAADDLFEVGDRVRVLRGPDGSARVVR
jgi:outer membrane lipoprotein SlyB